MTPLNYLCRFVCEQDKLFFLNYWAKALIVLGILYPDLKVGASEVRKRRLVNEHQDYLVLKLFYKKTFEFLNPQSQNPKP